MNQTLARLLVRHHRLLAFISILLTLLAISGVMRMEFIADFSTLHGENSSEQADIDAVSAKYTSADSVYIILQPNADTIFSPHWLQLVEDVTEKAWTLPYVSRVDSLTNHQRIQVNGDDFIVTDLVTDASTLSPAQIDDIKNYALSQPDLLNRFISAQGDVTALQLSIQLPEHAFAAKAEMMTAVRALRDQLQQQEPQLHVYLVGEPVLEYALLEITLADGKVLFPLIGVFCVLALIFLLRTPAVVVGASILIACSILLSLGLSGWLGYDLDPLSAITPNMVLMLAMADAIHLLTQYVINLRQGMSRQHAMEQSLTTNLGPIFLTSITTAVGFLGMNFADSSAFHDFGNMTAIGVMVALVLTATLLPALMLYLPMTGNAHRPLSMSRLMAAVGNVVVRHYRRFFWLALIIVVAAVGFIPRNQLNDNLVDYFDRELAVRESAEFASQHLSGFQTFQYSFDSGEEQGINNPQFLRQINRFAEWLRTQPEVTQVFSYTDVLMRINQNMHDNNPEWKRIPDSRQEAAQYSLLYEMSLQYGQDLSTQITIDHSALLMTVLLKKLNNEQLIAVQDRTNNWLQANAPELQTPATGRAVMFAHVGQHIIHSMMGGAVIAMVLMTLMLCIGLRSIKYGLISLIPNALPAIIVYGFWGLFVGEVNMAAAVTFTISLGIVVDDTVHFLSKFLRARERGESTEEGIRYAISTAGTAMLTTTCVLVGSMLILGQSNFGINATIAMMMVPILSTALVLDFTLLPALLLMLNRWLGNSPKAKGH
ncbi:MAG: MMPL family transporter [Oleibacter sp.]|nr:MMPL family transporter [Thalassolituus sp.]